MSIRWEYKTERYLRYDDIEDSLAPYGNEGWELCHVHHKTWKSLNDTHGVFKAIFKRPKPPNIE